MHTRKYRSLLAGLLAGAGMFLAANGQDAAAFLAEAALDGAISIKSQEAVVNVPVQNLEYQVKWMKAPIKVDGDKSDWEKSGAKPVRFAGDKFASWSKGQYGGEKDFAADVWLGRDFNNFYIGVELQDDKLPAAGRVQVSFTDAKTAVIAGWQDVGMRVKPDDLWIVFVVKQDGTVGVHMAHLQQRMDRNKIQESYGSEAERLAMLQQEGPQKASEYKIFTASKRKMDGEKSTTFVEVALPWKTMLPFDPVKGHPVKMNIGMEDNDVDGLNQSGGALAWLPGLIGTYSGGHFPTLTFEQPSGRQGIDAFAQVGKFHFLKADIKADVSFLNHGAETSGKLQLLAAPGTGAPLAEIDVKVPAGVSAASVSVNSEDVKQKSLELMGRLVLEDGKKVDFPVFAPCADNTVTVQHAAEIEARINKLQENYESLSKLYEKVEAEGLETVYPKAYLTLLKMFIPRSRGDLAAGDSDRVIRNTEHLEEIYAKASAYMNEILKNPGAQLKVPAKFDPEKLRIKDGYWYNGKDPVFLWGPCTFWYLVGDTPLVTDLGFNSVCPEVPHEENKRAEAVAHMEHWRTNGVHVNAALSVPGLGLTGADANRSPVLKEHPDLKNLDANNFLSFVVQHPLVEKLVDEAFMKDVEFWKQFRGVNSYWLWNEPWYLNYSELTRQDFIKAMQKKYKNIADLNARWKSNYKSFEDIQLIQWPDAKNYAPWYDFQVFRDDLLVNFFGMLDKTSKKYNKNMPTHTKFMSASLHSFNMERLQGLYDIAGHDGSAGDRDIPFLDFCRSVYPEKPLSNTEVHMGYGGKESVENQVWRLAFHGLANGNWWCWHSNQRFSDSLSNSESMHALAIAGLDIQRLMVPHMHSLVMKDKPIATLFPDVVERRNDVKMVRVRFELAVTQYMLGLQPFYATEKRIAEGELKNHKALFAGESAYLKDKTYESIVKWVEGGGTLITTKGGFSSDEYGDPRDASELVKTEGGEPYGEYARVYDLGKGKVICIDEIELLADPVLDGGISMRGSPTFENNDRRRVYYKVLERFMADNAIDDEVRLVPTGAAKENPDAMYGFDWRAVEIDGAYTLCVLPYAAGEGPYPVKLQTKRPVAKITNLITEKEIPVDKFEIKPGANMFSIVLAE